MTTSTKYQLEAALKKYLLKKPLDKITIHDLTEECGISRMAFYYHFKDIYDLVEWSCIEDAKRALNGKKTKDTWQEGLLDIFAAIYENKPFIMNAYHSINREQLETFLYQRTFELLYDVVESQVKDHQISKSDQEFIAQFYKYSFVGLVLEWINQGMTADYRSLAEKMITLMEGAIDTAINKFEK